MGECVQAGRQAAEAFALSGDGRLAAFLAARLAEVEAAATLAAKYNPAPWAVDDLGDLRDAKDAEIFGPGGYEGVAFYESTAQFVADHDPDRALREVEADRTILAEHAKAHRAYQQARDDHARNLDLDRTETQLASAVALDKLIVWERVVSIRAARFSGHPDYQAGWKP
jgi:hypothetical protein